MAKGILHTHYLVVILFLLIYVVKTVLLLSNRKDLLAAFTKKIKIPEIIISFLFLATGIYLMIQLPVIHYLMWVKLVLVFASIPIAVIGFKKGNKILAALSLMMITASFGIAEIAKKKKMQADNTHIVATDGKALYENNCKLCHGDDGRLGAMGSKDISSTPLDVAGIKNVILNGQSSMAKVPVTEEQATAIAEYVNSNLKGH
ncbi:MAG: cytochrome c [Bacteroidetes bacterium]|nr:cytochrome c [Bacteroidota bacterium]